jgi:hypothetical protein
MAAISLTLLPPMLKTVSLPTLSAAGKNSRTASMDEKVFTFII